LNEPVEAHCILGRIRIGETELAGRIRGDIADGDPLDGRVQAPGCFDFVGSVGLALGRDGHIGRACFPDAEEGRNQVGTPGKTNTDEVGRPDMNRP